MSYKKIQAIMKTDEAGTIETLDIVNKRTQEVESVDLTIVGVCPIKGITLGKGAIGGKEKYLVLDDYTDELLMEYVQIRSAASFVERYVCPHVQRCTNHRPSRPQTCQPDGELTEIEQRIIALAVSTDGHVTDISKGLSIGLYIFPREQVIESIQGLLSDGIITLDTHPVTVKGGEQTEETFLYLSDDKYDETMSRLSSDLQQVAGWEPPVQTVQTEEVVTDETQPLTLTTNELDVVKVLMEDNEYEAGSLWTELLVERSWMTPKALGGVLSSMTQKGVLWSDGETTGLTDEGLDWYFANVNPDHYSNPNRPQPTDTLPEEITLTVDSDSDGSDELDLDELTTGTHGPGHCCECDEHDKNICRSLATYPDGSMDEPVCVDCCTCDGCRVNRIHSTETQVQETPSSEVQSETQDMDLPEVVTLSTETPQMDGDVEIPSNLPQDLHELYRSATEDERTAFDTLLSTASRPKKKRRPKKDHEPGSQHARRMEENKAGVSGFEAFLAMLYRGNMSLDEMIDRWEELSGKENRRHTLKTYVYRLRNGKTGNKKFRGLCVDIVEDESGKLDPQGGIPSEVVEVLDKLGESEIQRIVGPLSLEV